MEENKESEPVSIDNLPEPEVDHLIENIATYIRMVSPTDSLFVVVVGGKNYRGSISNIGFNNIEEQDLKIPLILRYVAGWIESSKRKKEEPNNGRESSS